MNRRMVLAALMALAPVAASAHQLNVFAYVEGAEVVVEAKFSSGRAPNAGQVVVFDAADVEVGRHDLAQDGTLRFALDPSAAAGGLRIEVTAGGHSDYWLLTPQDIEAGQGGS